MLFNSQILSKEKIYSPTWVQINTCRYRQRYTKRCLGDNKYTQKHTQKHTQPRQTHINTHKHTWECCAHMESGFMCVLCVCLYVHVCSHGVCKCVYRHTTDTKIITNLWNFWVNAKIVNPQNDRPKFCHPSSQDVSTASCWLVFRGFQVFHSISSSFLMYLICREAIEKNENLSFLIEWMMILWN